jgi:hypothetical protein
MVTGEAGLFVRFFIFANAVPDYEKWFFQPETTGLSSWHTVANLLI